MLYAKRKKIKENLEKLKKSNPNPPVVSQHLSWQEEIGCGERDGKRGLIQVGWVWGGGGCENNVQCGRRTQVRGGEQCGKEDTSGGGREGQVITPTCTD